MSTMKTTPPRAGIERRDSLTTAERRELTRSRIAAKKQADNYKVMQMVEKAQRLSQKAVIEGRTAPTKEELLADPEQEQMLRVKRLGDIGHSLSQRPSQMMAGSKSQPTQVQLNYFVNEISDIDANSQCFTIDFYLDVMWTDARMKDLEPDDTGLVDWAKVWSPALEVANARSCEKLFENYLVEDGGQGRIKIQSRIRAVCGAEMDLRQFPFDAQTLAVVIESAEHEADEVELIPYEHAGSSLSEHVKGMHDRSEWKVDFTSATSKRQTLEFDGSVYSRFLLEVVVIRQVGYYAKKVYLIIMIITAMNWSVYFIDPMSDVADRVGISSTLALTAVAFQFVVSDSLPKVPYLTRMDKYMNYCFVNIAIAVPLSLITYRLDKDPNRDHETVQIVDWIFLVASIVMFVFCTAISFLRGYHHRRKADANNDGQLTADEVRNWHKRESVQRRSSDSN